MLYLLLMVKNKMITAAEASTKTAGKKILFRVLSSGRTDLVNENLLSSIWLKLSKSKLSFDVRINSVPDLIEESFEFLISVT